MYKHIALLVRREGERHDEFRERWLDERAPQVREIDGVVRHHTVVPTGPEVAEFDGIAELYFESLDDLDAAVGSIGARGDDHFAAGEPRRFDGEEVVRKDETGGDTDGLYKHSAFLVRKPGTSHDDFRDYWETEHTPLARDIEGVVRYHTVYPVDPESAAFDGVAELYFESLADLYDALGSPGSRDYDPSKEVAAAARADVDNFLAVEDRPRLIGRETVQFDATDAEGY
ncbi:EthD domain-containing protein [Halosimplex pelagicum]|uniref:EthD family reductase n=1 Tax=Halosimplex pelagicum TaxID=869886 RepID=A0A7D5PDZ4_9EURY|nr:EthD domain-containing protein [Halosimplex pelagicum]QLH80879.1 EthD family reductase [Halosimplex pelagicum]